MIPEGLEWALEAGRTVSYRAGGGTTIVRRLADLVLPTGRVLMGYPGSRFVDDPSPVRLIVSPGRYPVFASQVDGPSSHKALAFVVVPFEDTQPSAWMEAGSFFTDSGTGCLMDKASVSFLRIRQKANSDFRRLFHDQKRGIFRGGDCNLVLDESTGANAIVFQTFDCTYPCFMGDRS